MLFNSLEFLVFLPVVLGLYYSLKPRAQNVMLVAASYFFYGWWDWRFCGLLAVSTVVDYACGLGIGAQPGRKKAWVTASVVVNLGILGFFKYFNFFIDSAGALLARAGLEANLPVLRIILPVGISFYTFQTMAYTLDVYRGRLVPTRNFVDFALYVSYFPQLVAGPIERATNLLGQLARPRVVTREKIETGCFLILLGLFRKVAIADGVAPTVNAIFADPGSQTWAALVQGMWLFAIQIYGDFCGYSDIARGTSRLLGIELMENFNQPYLSRNITEFWRRWHISLSTWLRDYLYIPLGGNRRGTAMTYRNLMLTMLLGGLWHGARWTFVAWGAIHGVALAAHKYRLERGGRGPVAAGGRWTLRDIGAALATFHLVMLAWIFFRASSFGQAWAYLSGLAGGRGGWEAWTGGGGLQVMLFSLLVLATDVPQYRGGRHEALLQWPWAARGLAYAGMLLAMVLLRPMNEMPFIYFQF